MIRWSILLLPVLGILAVDPGAADYHAVKYVALMAGAFVCAALSLGRFASSSVSVALWVFVAVRGWMLLASPMPGRALRWWSLLAALTVVHQAACATTSRRWLARHAPPVLGSVAVLLALYAVVQSFTLPQAHTLFAHRNFAGAGLAMLLPFALAVPRRGPWLAVVVVIGLIAVRSRGGLLAAAAAGALWLVWTRPRLRWPVLLGLPALVLACGLAFGESKTVKVRLAWYEAALAMGLEHPVTGVGADGFAREYPPVRPAKEHRISRGGKVHAVHNDYLESFAEGGLIGLGAHLFLLVAAALAVRRHRIAAASLLAFAVASLVDLPLRDPSLLALAILPLTMAARRWRAGWAWTHSVSGLLLITLAFPFGWWHWRADRLVTAGEFREALAIEPLHPEALILRSSMADLNALIKLEPHNADAHYNETRWLDDDDARAALEKILRFHDPHHALTRGRLARLNVQWANRSAAGVEPLLDEKPLRAASYLEGLIQETPDAYLPYLLMARLHRVGGRQEQAARYLWKAQEREHNADVARERLAFERAELQEGRWSQAAVLAAVIVLPPAEVAARIEEVLRHASGIEKAHPAPRVEKKEGEDATAYARRITKAKEEWRADLDARTRPAYLEAVLLADALAAARPSIPHFRLLARAARGLHDLNRARQAEALALFGETLEALAKENERRAKSRLERALRAYPELGEERAVRGMLRLFAARSPAAVPAARRLFAYHPQLAAALE